MTKNLKVRLRDFSEKDSEKLEKIFQVTGSRARTYSLAKPTDHTDLLLIDIDEMTAFDSNNYLDAISPETPVITVGKSDKPLGSDYHIKGLLLATRVIRVLDQVEILTRGDTSEQRADANNAENISYAHTVLVVDDSDLMRQAIALELKKTALPLCVDFAESGEQALDKVVEKTYDFIFLDVMMPGIDGYETCGQIRKMTAMKKTPIIMLSAKTSPLDEVKGVMAGCTSYITKPIKSDEFQNMLDRVMHWLSNYKKQ